VYDTVLVPLDGSERAERALTPARELARREGADLHLVTCTWYGDPLVPKAPADEYLAAVAGRWTPAAATSVLPESEPGSAIAALAGTLHPCLVCMTTHGRTGVGQALLGSVAESTIRHIQGPMLLFGPDAPASVLPLDRGVVAVDGSPASEAVAGVAGDWARAFGLELVVVEVIDPDDLETARKSGIPVAIEVETVQRIAAGIGDGLEPSWEVLHGTDAAAAIVDYMARAERSVLFLGTHGRTGMARLLVGSVAMSVVRNADVPVVLCPPDVSDASPPGGSGRG